VLYADVVKAVEPTGFLARGGFLVGPDEAVPDAPGGPTRTVVIVGNVGGAIWHRFRAVQPAGPDPLDTWTRSVLEPIARHFGAGFVHPSDEPFQPFQRWAQRADDVWQSPIGLLVHPDHGLWHAYRGALLFPVAIDGLPPIGARTSPCVGCPQPCLSTCPVGAFTPGHYDVEACTGHVRSGAEPACLERGCAARRACPVGVSDRYGPDQMRFHMSAFVGARS
jgi:ferredoxin